MHPRPSPPVWLWFNVLSLDAPLIALVWQDFLARCYPTTLHPAGRAVLGLTVWVIYLADRLLDVRLPPTAFESIRHRFYRRHQTFAKALLATVALLDVLLVRLWLRPAVFDNGLLVTAAVLAYLCAFPLTRRGIAIWKKPLAAILFTAGTFLIAWTSARHAAAQLVWPAAAFCALCLGNLLMIGHWSRRTTPRRRDLSLAWLCLLILAGLARASGSAWFTAIVASAVGLCALARWGKKISCEARCVLADVLLLTPLLFR